MCVCVPSCWVVCRVKHKILKTFRDYSKDKKNSRHPNVETGVWTLRLALICIGLALRVAQTEVWLLATACHLRQSDNTSASCVWESIWYIVNALYIYIWILCVYNMYIWVYVYIMCVYIYIQYISVYSIYTVYIYSIYIYIQHIYMYLNCIYSFFVYNII